MGGTTLDLGLVRDGAHEVNPEPEIRGVPVSLPVPGIVSVGLGGSSIASADSSGTVTVGPASAGAVPGPAAFGRGGAEPTLTDADMELGLLADGEVLPGDIVLDAGRASAALAPLADGDATAAARLVHEAAHNKAAAAIENLLSRSGVDPAEATLYAFGGAGGLHAGPVAALVGISRVRSVAAGGVFSARGVAEAALDGSALGRWHDADRSLPGGVVAGPALVNVSGAVHAVPSGWTARSDGVDSLLWERAG
ncbi:MAG: hypothetical protein OXG66_05325 [Acidimicrobiaceae bacterium]|nr:hypothetical protein [Acidimicrobiaceae bacterium]